jgi:hypothetical protein
MGERRKVQKQNPKKVACGHTLRANPVCEGLFVGGGWRRRQKIKKQTPTTYGGKDFLPVPIG